MTKGPPEVATPASRALYHPRSNETPLGGWGGPPAQTTTDESVRLNKRLETLLPPYLTSTVTTPSEGMGSVLYLLRSLPFRQVLKDCSTLLSFHSEPSCTFADARLTPLLTLRGTARGSVLLEGACVAESAIDCMSAISARELVGPESGAGGDG